MVVFALLLCVDVSEEGAKVIDAAEVFEVEDLFHGGGVDKINQCCCISLLYVAKVRFSEDWGLVVVLLGLATIIVGLLMILYAFFKWLF